jgi:micrococcal nuclease
MQILRILTLCAVAATATSQTTTGPDVVPVRSVVDGDTIRVAYYGTVHLAGIRAPKVGRRGRDGLAEQARRRLEALIGHHFVWLEFPTWSRSTAYVKLQDGTLVNAILVSEGLAQVSGRPPGGHGEELLRAEERAKSVRAGVWSLPPR